MEEHSSHWRDVSRIDVNFTTEFQEIWEGGRRSGKEEVPH